MIYNFALDYHLARTYCGHPSVPGISFFLPAPYFWKHKPARQYPALYHVNRLIRGEIFAAVQARSERVGFCEYACYQIYRANRDSKTRQVMDLLELIAPKDGRPIPDNVLAEFNRLARIYLSVTP